MKGKRFKEKTFPFTVCLERSPVNFTYLVNVYFKKKGEAKRLFNCWLPNGLEEKL